jgi:AbrB family looped-hinge helix DNA binding protein
MSRIPTKVINDGRVTIPADVRRELELEKGDYVLVDVQPLEEAEA